MSRTPILGFAALAALAFVGCGGGGEGSHTAPSTSASPATTKSANTSSPAGSGSRKSGSAARNEQTKPPADLPPPTPGSKSAAPGVPTSKYGDNSIQTWGLEASDAERRAATRIVKAYLDARAARNWGTACRLLAAKPRREQSRIARDTGCARAMAAFAARAQTSALRREAQIEVLSFRVGHKYAFLIYRRPDGIVATALTREAGDWKLISVTPNPLA